MFSLPHLVLQQHAADRRFLHAIMQTAVIFINEIVLRTA